MSCRSKLCLFLLVFLAFSLELRAEKVSYSSQIQPILSEYCFKCHGQDEKQRKGDLRLDVREAAVAAKAIVPGSPDESLFIQRILTHDPDEVMPPPKEKKLLGSEQVALVKQWISEGAEYERHWSFVPPEKPAVPVIEDLARAVENEIDSFVQKPLVEAGIPQAKPASRVEWLRRVTFDLTGLPPTLKELDDFLADTSSGAFEKVVDRLLASSAYGERMAVEWLDVARYADTYGRHEDHDSLTWPYRDWVIRAFNDNMPYDKFVIWQTAGDMLPAPTQDMYLATAFNRLPQQSNEAGSNEEEFRQDIVADRVHTNGTAFLGLSLECARCHDHKYDPISTKDYYSFSAFLNNIDESGLYTVYTSNIPAPSMFVYDGDDERLHAEVKLRIRLKEQEQEAALKGARVRFARWLKDTGTGMKVPAPQVHLDFEELGEDKTVPNAANAEKPGRVRLKTKLEDGRKGKAIRFQGDNSLSVAQEGRFSRTDPFSISLWLKLEEPVQRAVVVHNSRAGLDAGSMGYEVLLEDTRPSFALCHFWPGNAMRVRGVKPLPLGWWTHVAVTYDGSSRAAGMRLYVNGQAVEQEIVRDNLYKDIVYNEVFMDKDSVQGATLTLAGRHNDRSLSAALVDEFKAYNCELSPVEIRLDAGLARDPEPREWFEWWLREIDEPWRRASVELNQLRVEENTISGRVREIMVMREQPGDRRATHVLERGHFEAKGEPVLPGTPESVLPFPEDLPRNRLGLATWLVDRKNPLTARVQVNRVWQMFMGRGLVVTSEDFGLQGQQPSHPELLDWLAVWFMDNGWDMKALCKLISLSATYRQSSLPVQMEMLADDPENVRLARGPRQRLTAEQLRDNALAVSGLLDRRILGAPVMPYQPAGLWEDSGTQHSYSQSKGADLYRRSVYTFWRRTLPPPSMSVFDAPTREYCKTRRDKSSNPLQALVLFNDPQFLEAARVLAEKLVREFPGDDAGRVRRAHRLLTSREADAWRVGLFSRLLAEERLHFETVPAEADDVRRKNGESPPDESLSAVEVAATTLLVRALLASDDCVMKP